MTKERHMERSGKRRGFFGWAWVVTKWSGVGLVAVLVLAAVLWCFGAPPREDYQSQMIELLDKRLGTSRRDATNLVHSLGAEAKKVLAEANDAANLKYEQQRASAPESSMAPWLNLVWMDAAYKADTELKMYRVEAARAAYERLVEMGYLDKLRTFREYDCIVSPDIEHLHAFDLYTPSLLIQHIISPSRLRWEDAMVRADDREVLETSRDLVHLIRLSGSEGHSRSIRFVNGFSEHLLDSLARLENELAELSPVVLRELMAVFGERPPIPTPRDVAAMSRVELLYSIDHQVRVDNNRIEMILMRIAGEPRRFSRIAKRAFAASMAYIDTERRERQPLDDLFRSVDREDDNFGRGPILDLRNHLDVAEVMWSGIRVQIALACYKAEHGAYPEALDALVPEILPALPQDVFAALGSFGYRRLDAETDPHGRGYLLWSVGGDGVDNNGTPWRPTQGYGRVNEFSKAFGVWDSGVDYVMNLPISKSIRSSGE